MNNNVNEANVKLYFQQEEDIESLELQCLQKRLKAEAQASAIDDLKRQLAEANSLKDRLATRNQEKQKTNENMKQIWKTSKSLMSLILDPNGVQKLPRLQDKYNKLLEKNNKLALKNLVEDEKQLESIYAKNPIIQEIKCKEEENNKIKAEITVATEKRNAIIKKVDDVNESIIKNRNAFVLQIVELKRNNDLEFDKLCKATEDLKIRKCERERLQTLLELKESELNKKKNVLKNTGMVDTIKMAIPKLEYLVIPQVKESAKGLTSNPRKHQPNSALQSQILHKSAVEISPKIDNRNKKKFSLKIPASKQTSDKIPVPNSIQIDKQIGSTVNSNLSPTIKQTSDKIPVPNSIQIDKQIGSTVNSNLSPTIASQNKKRSFNASSSHSVSKKVCHETMQTEPKNGRQENTHENKDSRRLVTQTISCGKESTKKLLQNVNKAIKITPENENALQFYEQDKHLSTDIKTQQEEQFELSSVKSKNSSDTDKSLEQFKSFDGDQFELDDNTSEMNFNCSSMDFNIDFGDTDGNFLIPEFTNDAQGNSEVVGSNDFDINNNADNDFVFD